MFNIFEEKIPAHQRYEFGSLDVGEYATILLGGETPAKIRSHIYAHSKYYGKKFKTRSGYGVLHVMRVK